MVDTISVYPLSMFRWRKTQRRLVCENAWVARLDKFYIEGEAMKVLFIQDRIDVDPRSRKKKQAAIYKPCAVSTPKEKQDIILYVHID